MGGVKTLRRGTASIMAVSKFLHFFNPRLFPIYDNAVVRHQAFPVFAESLKESRTKWAPRTASLKQTSAYLLGLGDYLDYLLWAADSWAGVDADEAMRLFVREFNEMIDREQRGARVPAAMERNYANAFEFAMIGEVARRKGTVLSDQSRNKAEANQQTRTSATAGTLPGTAADSLSLVTQADLLRQRYHALPKAAREANEGYRIRVWRALSWLDRAERHDPADIEGRFISAWIGFNALYGQLDPERRAYGDREAWSTLLAQVWRIDSHGQIQRAMTKRRMAIFRIIDDKYLYHRFWAEGDAAMPTFHEERRHAMAWFDGPKMQKVLRLLFDRLYVMRNQLLHGASTKGSKLNRRPLREAGNLLIELLAVMLGVVIDHGAGEDWGQLCYPPEGPKPGKSLADG